MTQLVEILLRRNHKWEKKPIPLSPFAANIKPTVFLWWSEACCLIAVMLTEHGVLGVHHRKEFKDATESARETDGLLENNSTLS